MELFEKEEEGSEELEEGDTPVSVLELNGLLEIVLEKRTCWNTFKQRDVEKKHWREGWDIIRFRFFGGALVEEIYLGHGLILVRMVISWLAGLASQSLLEIFGWQRFIWMVGMGFYLDGYG